MRSDIVWAKANPMPESVTDRPTKAHEYIFLLTKAERYFYDAEAVRESVTGNAHARGDGINPKARASHKVPQGWDTDPGAHTSIHRKGRAPDTRYRSKQNESWSGAVAGLVSSRNLRSVWTAKPDLWQLRSDLSDDDRAYVLGELLKRGARC